MLFGEYSIILGSMGLTIPYAHFNGGLGFINSNNYTDLDYARESNRLIKDYYQYLCELETSGKLPPDFNISRFKTEIDAGLYFESSIPEGYGLGSSGALVASLYQRYAGDGKSSGNKITGREISALKNKMALLESYFHGTSSGIDPLICYLKHPLLLKDQENIIPIDIPRYEIKSDDAIFLVNSGKPGKTAPLVKQFLMDCENPVYLGKMKNEYITLNNNCINSLIEGNVRNFFKNLNELSIFQAINFRRMIPENLEEGWQFGLSTGEYCLKLCGSGGGGFVLGFTHNYSGTLERFSQKGLNVIPVYQLVKK